MAKKFFTRDEIQTILESNSLGAPVSYMARDTIREDNAILYERYQSGSQIFADDHVHIRSLIIQVIHFKKRKLDSIDQLMLDNFNVEANAFDMEQLSDDYFGDYYRFEILTERTGW